MSPKPTPAKTAALKTGAKAGKPADTARKALADQDLLAQVRGLFLATRQTVAQGVNSALTTSVRMASSNELSYKPLHQALLLRRSDTIIPNPDNQLNLFAF